VLQPRAIGAAHYCTAVGTLASPLSSLAGPWSQEREGGGVRAVTSERRAALEADGSFHFRPLLISVPALCPPLTLRQLFAMALVPALALFPWPSFPPCVSASRSLFLFLFTSHLVSDFLFPADLQDRSDPQQLPALWLRQLKSLRDCIQGTPHL
jgi:hypothetical protein